MRLVLRSVNVLLEFGLAGHDAETVGFAGLGMDLMVPFLFYDFF